jgi:hypothetical protein
MTDRKPPIVDDDDEPCVATEKSSIAKEIEGLQTTILRFARDRERLPQPLFWSLFNSRIREIKQNKEVRRVLQEALGESDS